jgi:hypothetical protein
VAAGQRLSGKAFRDHKDAALAGTRPKDWESFRTWLVRLSPLGVTPQSIADELERLKQGPNETFQAFYERFRDWQTKAKSINFGHDERTCFVKRLTPGLSNKVQGLMSQEQIRNTPMTMDQVIATAMQHDHLFRQKVVASTSSGSGSGSGKRRAESSAGGSDKKKSGSRTCHNCKGPGHIAMTCPEPKTDQQKAWEAKNAEQKKKE